MNTQNIDLSNIIKFYGFCQIEDQQHQKNTRYWRYDFSPDKPFTLYPEAVELLSFFADQQIQGEVVGSNILTGSTTKIIDARGYREYLDDTDVTTVASALTIGARDALAITDEVGTWEFQREQVGTTDLRKQITEKNRMIDELRYKLETSDIAVAGLLNKILITFSLFILIVLYLFFIK